MKTLRAIALSSLVAVCLGFSAHVAKNARAETLALPGPISPCLTTPEVGGSQIICLGQVPAFNPALGGLNEAILEVSGSGSLTVGPGFFETLPFEALTPPTPGQIELSPAVNFQLDLRNFDFTIPTELVSLSLTSIDPIPVIANPIGVNPDTNETIFQGTASRGDGEVQISAELRITVPASDLLPPIDPELWFLNMSGLITSSLAGSDFPGIATNTFGSVGLNMVWTPTVTYSFSPNSVIPIPAALPLLLSGLAVLGLISSRGRRAA